MSAILLKFLSLTKEKLHKGKILKEIQETSRVCGETNIQLQ